MSLFFFQALVPQEGEAKAEVFNNSSSPHYFCTIWLWIVIYLFILLNEDSIVHCVLWFFFPESEIRVRLQSASPTPCRCKTSQSICCCYASSQNFFSFCPVPEYIHSKNHLHSERLFTMGCLFWIMWIRFILRSTSHMRVYKILICNTCCS